MTTEEHTNYLKTMSEMTQGLQERMNEADAARQAATTQEGVLSAVRDVQLLGNAMRGLKTAEFQIKQLQPNDDVPRAKSGLSS